MSPCGANFGGTMWPVRVYLPTTLAALADASAEIAPPGATAFAVTPALREWYREGDIEELEYVAMTHAARASLRLLAALPGAGTPGSGQTRRVVLAADVPDAAARPSPDVDVAAVRLEAGVRLDAVASAHVDDPAAADDVRAALAVLDAATRGDDDAQFVLDGLDDHELQWYAVQEIPFLLG